MGFFLFGRYTSKVYAIAWLVIASLFYYGWWNPKYLLLIGFSILFNYYIGMFLVPARKIKLGNRATLLLIFGVVVNLSLIGYFKYTNFLVDTINTAGGTEWNIVHIILPIGISFFTFQQIAYLIDARRGETKEHNFINYCLFVVFFPQLIAGPIVHHKEMLPQFGLRETYRPFIENLAIGCTIFCVGLFKKVVIADNLALIATPVFEAADSGQTLYFFQAWRGTIAYSLQLYFDFSGYSDMAIGLARMFGIRLPLNFHSPYKATSIIDFWRRWHMTLSRFLRDYVYIPLGGRRHGTTRRHLNIMITMLLGGLWHGAGWTFVFWGGLHGLFLIINHGWRRLWHTKIDRWWSLLIAKALTLFSVALAWVFFRAETFDGAIRIFKGMCNLPQTLRDKMPYLATHLQTLGFRFDAPLIESQDIISVAWLIWWLAVLWILPNTQQWLSRFRPALDYNKHHGLLDRRVSMLDRFSCFHWRPIMLWGIYGGLLFSVSLLSMSRVSEFLYFQF